MFKQLRNRRVLPNLSRVLGISAAASLLLSAWQASASINPAGCNANNLTVNIAKNHNNIQNGDTVIFTVTISNPNTPDSCDITLGPSGLVFTCPGPDGSPSGAQTVLIPGGTLLP